MNRPGVGTGAVFKWFFVYLIIFLISASVLFAFLYYDYQKNQSDPDVRKEEETGKLIYIKGDIPEGYKIYQYDEADKKHQEVLNNSYDLLEFSDKNKLLIVQKNQELFKYNSENSELTKINIQLFEDEEKSQFVERIILSLNQNKALIILRTQYHDSEREYTDPNDEYVYDIKTDAVKKVDYVNQSDISFNDNTIYWDSEKNKFYYYQESSPPLKIYNIKTKKHLSQDYQPDSEFCPSLNQYLTEFIFTPGYNSQNTQFILFSIDEIDKPILEFALDKKNSAYPKYQEGYSTIWDYNDQEIYLITDNSVYKVEIDEKRSTKLYEAEKSINNNFVVISNDGQFLYFNEGGAQDRYKLIRLNTNNKETEILTEAEGIINPIGYYK